MRLHSALSVISLKDEEVVRSIFRAAQHPTEAYRDLRRKIFREVANSPTLQSMFLDLLSGDTVSQKVLVQELANNPQLKRRFFVLASGRKKSRAGS